MQRNNPGVIKTWIDRMILCIILFIVYDSIPCEVYRFSVLMSFWTIGWFIKFEHFTPWYRHLLLQKVFGLRLWPQVSSMSWQKDNNNQFHTYLKSTVPNDPQESIISLWEDADTFCLISDKCPWLNTWWIHLKLFSLLWVTAVHPEVRLSDKRRWYLGR